MPRCAAPAACPPCRGAHAAPAQSEDTKAAEFEARVAAFQQRFGRVESSEMACAGAAEAVRVCYGESKSKPLLCAGVVEAFAECAAGARHVRQPSPLQHPHPSPSPSFWQARLGE